MSDQIEELIREIAAKHGIAVARDDPILVLQTINNRLLIDSAKAQQAQLDTYKEEMEALAQRWAADTKEKSERILNAALSASKEAMGQIMLKGADSTTAKVRDQVDIALHQVVVPIRHAQLICKLNILASVTTLVAVAILGWSIRHL
ncbi:MAG: conjugal transfer protein TraM [Kiritimatiellae bacterium]|nr:conjugal transfer protein TraM [Kiritimatiellia bacterium]